MGLLEDAIAAGGGNQLAQLSSLFAPSANQAVYNQEAAMPASQLPEVNPLTGRQWGEYNAIYQNKDTAAQEDRDKARIALLGTIGKIDDPDLQAQLLTRYGFRPQRPTQMGSIEGLSPTDALAVQQRGPVSPEEQFMGTKLRNELVKLQFANALQAPEREAAANLRNLQAQVALQNAQTNAEYRKALEARGATTANTGMLGVLAKLATAHQAASQPFGGNPARAQMLKEVMDLISSQVMGQGGATGGGTENPSGPVAWWDQVAPMNATPSTPVAAPATQAAPPVGGWGAARMRAAAPNVGGLVINNFRRVR
jgi:hypothetical protein